MLPEVLHGPQIGIIGAGAVGVIVGYELMKLGAILSCLKLGNSVVVCGPGLLKGRKVLSPNWVACGSGLVHGLLSLCGFAGYQKCALSKSLTSTARSTVIDLLGQTYYAKTLNDLPPLFREVANAYDAALEDGANFSALKQAIRDRDTKRIKEIWNPLVSTWMKGHSMISLRRLMRSKTVIPSPRSLWSSRFWDRWLGLRRFQFYARNLAGQCNRMR